MRVSVVIPAFNAEKWIETAVRSAWEQSWRPQEVIVASDGSNDRTAEIAAAAGATVLQLPRGNANVARNAGVGASSGEILFFLDADDWFHPEKIASHLPSHDARTWSFVVDPSMAVTSEGEGVRLMGPPINGALGYEGFLRRRHWYGGSSFSVARSKLDAIGGWREELTSQQDVDLWIRLAHLHGPAFIQGESKTFYRLSEGSTSRNPTRVRENLDRLLLGLSFLSRRQRRLLYSQVIFTAADNLPLKSALPLLATAIDRFYDPRFAQAILRSAKRGVS